MYRRLSHILIMITLILATAGVTVTKHYCGNRLVNTSLESEPKSCCGEHCNCCHNEAFSIKVTDEYVSSAHLQVPDTNVFSLDWAVFPFLLSFTAIQASDHSEEYSSYTSPPLIADNPSAMLQVFLC